MKKSRFEALLQKTKEVTPVSQLVQKEKTTIENQTHINTNERRFRSGAAVATYTAKLEAKIEGLEEKLSKALGFMVLTNTIDDATPKIRGDSVDKVLEKLTDSIRSYGILQPLIIRIKTSNKERFEIVAGGLRLQAAKRLGLKEVPAIIIDATDAEASSIFLAENLCRKKPSKHNTEKILINLSNTNPDTLKKSETYGVKTKDAKRIMKTKE